MRKLIKLSNQSKSIHFVFVSSWLKDASSHDLRIAIDNSSVIPNGIDTKMFKFQEKPENFRKNVLLLRSFKGKNYANDVSVDAIHILSRKPFFNQMQFNIYGEGYLYPRLTKTLKNFSNVFLNNHYVHNHEMPALHEQNGIFLCPSRLDTQGVLMCEAMASGLVPITSPIGGIPEYTEDAIDSFYVTSPGEMAEKLEYLFYHPIEFLEMSRNARLAVERKCSINQTVDLELSLFSALVANN